MTTKRKTATSNSPQPTNTTSGWANRAFQRLYESPQKALGSVALLTGLLLIPFLTMAPEISASTEPSGDVFTARDRIDETFVSSVHPTFLIAEPANGNVLTADSLNALLDAQQSLRDNPELGPNLLTYFNAETQTEVVGLLTLVDLVKVELADAGITNPTDATDQQVADAGAAVITEFGDRNELLGLSAQSTVDQSGNWTVPAIRVIVASNNELLGFENTSVNLGGDTTVEEYDREIQTALQQAPGWQVNGVAIDVNLTSQEQGAIAGPFIGLTILAVLLLVGLTFRSYWILATVSVMFIVLIIWLKGISNLIGLKDDLVLSLIVPVAMISFGVDFAFHAIGRYREERAEGRHSKAAFITGLAAVSGALVLALVSDTTAFLANLTSGIESINQFGIGAAIALTSAYLLLGIGAPLIIANVEGAVPTPRTGRRSTLARLAGGVGAAALTMTSVLLLVFIAPAVGVVASLLTTLAVLVIPFGIQRRKDTGQRVGEMPIDDQEERLAQPIGNIITAVAKRRYFVLPAALAVTGLAAVFAVQVPAEFDVEDFFSSETDFVQGLEQLDTHVGDRGGEPAAIYIEGNLTDPTALATLQNHINQIKDLETNALARDSEGVLVTGGIFSVFDAIWESEPMVPIIAEQTGVTVTDTNNDTIPDTTEQILAALSVASEVGVPFDQSRLILTPDDVNTVITLDQNSGVTVFEINVVDSRNQTSVTTARTLLEPIADAISQDMDGSFVQVTGSAFVREASLEGTNRALSISLPVALALCLLISSIFLRSLRYGLASIVPILMVVAWLYAFMYAANYAINLVTATIAAVSIGIGIDFAIHFIARYREELGRHGIREAAVQATGQSTGLALVASAISSAIGFGILAFAPMPLFAAYGLLTALMIMLALTATLLVLPSLLMTITSDQKTAP